MNLASKLKTWLGRSAAVSALLSGVWIDDTQASITALNSATGLPVNQIQTVKRLQALPYNNGGRQVIDVDRAGILTRLRIRVQYSNNNGATAPITPLFNQNARFVKKIELVMNGRDTPINVSGHYLVSRLEYTNFGCLPFGMETVISAVANNNTAVELVLDLDLDSINGRRRDDFGIDTRLLSQLQLAVTWGTVADLWGTPGGTVAIAFTAATVEGTYIINPPQNAAYLVRRLDEIQRPITGSQQELDQIIDRGSGLVYRTFLMVTETGSVADDTLIFNGNGNIKLLAGTFYYFNREAKMIRASARTDFDIPNTAVPAGTFFIDLEYDHQNVTGLDTSGLTADLRMLADVTYTAGTSLWTIQRESFSPPRIA